MRKAFRITLMVAILLGLSQALIAQNEAKKLESRVIDELGRYYLTSFKVTANDSGGVTIKGQVASFWDKRNVFSIAERVPGVKKISDLVKVVVETVPDKSIEYNIESDLALNRAIEDPSRITVSVKNGMVFLGGTVNFQREAAAAEDVASWNSGVNSVVNEIQVLPPQAAISDENLTVVLKDLINREFSMEEKTVSLQVMQGRVILKGTVPTLWARHNIEKEIKRIRGITAVENQLKIVLPGEMAK
jgi:osmotically-inducible protein OsmY